MRILHTSVVALGIVSLALISGVPGNGQGRLGQLEVGRIPSGRSSVAAPPDDAPKIDASKVKFLLARSCDSGLLAGPPNAHGIVAREIDLSEDLTAQQLLQMGITFVQEKCPSATYVFVYLRPGDPEAFTNPTQGFQFLRQTSSEYNWPGYPDDVINGGWRKSGPGLIVSYQNFPRALKNQQAYYAEQERQRNAALEQQRQAEQKVAARWAAFLKKNRVKHVVTIDQLTANPFVYEGQVVAISGMFERMNSRTQGIFSARGYRFVVSGISTARFTRTGSVVVLAGRVLGNIEVKPGSTEVPHLSFVAIYVAD